jgi:hypothetical protein
MKPVLKVLLIVRVDGGRDRNLRYGETIKFSWTNFILQTEARKRNIFMALTLQWESTDDDTIILSRNRHHISI